MGQSPNFQNKGVRSRVLDIATSESLRCHDVVDLKIAYRLYDVSYREMGHAMLSMGSPYPLSLSLLRYHGTSRRDPQSHQRTFA